MWRLIGPTLCVALALVVVESANAQVPIPGRVERFDRPDIGASTKREIGEPLLESGLSVTYDALRLTASRRVQVLKGFYADIQSSDLIANQTKRGVVYCSTAAIHKNNGKLMGMRPFCSTEAVLTSFGTSFTRAQVTREEPQNFRQELLYQGRSGGEVKISYREFSNDLARPAFTQDLTFDLGSGRVVGVKGARLEVLDATNTDITYRVLQPFAARP